MRAESQLGVVAWGGKEAHKACKARHGAGGGGLGGHNGVHVGTTYNQAQAGQWEMGGWSPAGTGALMRGRPRTGDGAQAGWQHATLTRFIAWGGCSSSGARCCAARQRSTAGADVDGGVALAGQHAEQRASLLLDLRLQIKPACLRGGRGCEWGGQRGRASLGLGGGAASAACCSCSARSERASERQRGPAPGGRGACGARELALQLELGPALGHLDLPPLKAHRHVAVGDGSALAGSHGANKQSAGLLALNLQQARVVASARGYVL